jgi:MOSC domain-containing protein YiiM
MKILSINVGLPREVKWRGKAVRTSIFKAPVAGRVHVTKLNLRGGRAVGSFGSRRRRQGGLCLSVRALRVLAQRVSRHGVSVWRVRREPDSIDLVAQDGNRITVSEVVRLYTEDGADQDLLRRAAELSALPDSWRDIFVSASWRRRSSSIRRGNANFDRR